MFAAFSDLLFINISYLLILFWTYDALSSFHSLLHVYIQKYLMVFTNAYIFIWSISKELLSRCNEKASKICNIVFLSFIRVLLEYITVPSFFFIYICWWKTLGQVWSCFSFLLFPQMLIILDETFPPPITHFSHLHWTSSSGPLYFHWRLYDSTVRLQLVILLTTFSRPIPNWV